jgi:type II secretory pathway component PulF
MDTFIGFGVEVLRLVPLILAFYVPALIGMAILKERGESYRLKAALVFLAGFGGIVALQLLARSASALQVAGTVGLSLVQIALALFFAALTVYKLAD